MRAEEIAATGASKDERGELSSEDEDVQCRNKLKWPGDVRAVGVSPWDFLENGKGRGTRREPKWEVEGKQSRYGS